MLFIPLLTVERARRELFVFIYIQMLPSHVFPDNDFPLTAVGKISIATKIFIDSTRVATNEKKNSK